jgi:hypothetical protein
MSPPAQTRQQLVDEFIPVHQFAALGFGDGLTQLRPQRLMCFIRVALLNLQEAQTLAHHFAGSLVAAARNATLNEFFKFRCQVVTPHIHCMEGAIRATDWERYLAVVVSGELWNR